MLHHQKKLCAGIVALLLAVLVGGFLNRAPTSVSLAGRLSGGGSASVAEQTIPAVPAVKENPPASAAALPTAAGDTAETSASQKGEAAPEVALPTLPASASAETSAPATAASSKKAAPSAGQQAAAAPKTTALISGVPHRDKLITDAEIKYYTYTAPARGTLRLSISSATRNDMSSRLVSVYQVYYLNGSSGEKGTRLLHKMTAYTKDAVNDSPKLGVYAGEYIITVSAGDYSDLSAYELTLTFAPGADYEIEYNNSPAHYTEIFSGVRVCGNGSILDEGTDCDWFMIRMHLTGALQLKFEHRANELMTAAFKVTLYDNDLQELYSGVSTHDLAVLESGTLGVPAGCYFICVESRVWFDGDYGLTVTKTAADLFEKEPNDTRAAATSMENGRGVTGALTERSGKPDQDYYVLTLPANGRFSVSLIAEASAPEEGDVEKYFRRLTLTDQRGAVVYRGLQPQSSETLNSGSMGLKAGVYYLLVDHDGLDADHGEYLLRYSFSPDAGWEVEPNDDSGNATVLTAGALYSAALSDRGTDFDADWYTFTLDHDCEITLTLTHGANATDASVYVMTLQNAAGAVCADHSGRQFIESRGGEGRATAEYTLPAGTYYALIRTGTFADHGVYGLLLNER